MLWHWEPIALGRVVDVWPSNPGIATGNWARGKKLSTLEGSWDRQKGRRKGKEKEDKSWWERRKRIVRKAGKGTEERKKEEPRNGEAGRLVPLYTLMKTSRAECTRSAT